MAHVILKIFNVFKKKKLSQFKEIIFKSSAQRGLIGGEDVKCLYEEDKAFELSRKESPAFNKNPKLAKFTSLPNDLASRKYVYFNELIRCDGRDKFDETSMFECDRESLEQNEECLDSNRAVNISCTAFGTFTKLIQVLGPVLTCKYCCVDLLKMLAICYMNTKCLSSIERSGSNKEFEKLNPAK